MVGSYLINDILHYNFNKFFYWSKDGIVFISYCVVIFILLSNDFMVNYGSSFFHYSFIFSFSGIRESAKIYVD